MRSRHSALAGVWRPEPESNRRTRICSPLRHHSAIGPRPPFQAGSGPLAIPWPQGNRNSPAFCSLGFRNGTLDARRAIGEEGPL